ncbi:MAG TPA: DUF2157 domain-containing protein [Bryobacteraceae bacterium]|nr:DUF2157 domain-containing protein [Bryobacteraceae bacterium]
MQIELESSLDRWTHASLLNSEQAARIREFEAAYAPRRSARVPILIGVALGGVMLAAGVLLFVAAHWMNLSPMQRMALLVFAVAGSHLAAAFSADRFPAMAVTLHAVGTAALGGAIFLAGQIFNMQEHWPTGVLLWAIGALAGWWLLRGWPQLASSVLLVPAWLIGEWIEAASQPMRAYPVVAVFCTLLAICYLSAWTSRTESGEPAVARTFAWIGGLGLIPAVLTLAVWNWWGAARTPSLDRWVVIGWIGAFLLPLSLSFFYRRTAAWMNAVAALWVGVLSALTVHHNPPLIFAWCALGSAGMIAWGIHEYRAERVNLGMAGFALTILLFYFSKVMDKLGRSTSLIVLGVVFLAGAWYWEKLRRKLVARVNAGGVA